MSKLESMIEKLKEVHLNYEQMQRAIPKDSNEICESYVPAADIVNLFPVIMSAAIVDLDKKDMDLTSNQEPHKHAETFAGAFLDNLLTEAFNDLDPKTFEKTLSHTLKRMEGLYPDLCADFYRNIALNTLSSYFVASKFGLRSVPMQMCGKGAFQYFALLEIFDDLPETAQDAILAHFGEKGLWGITEDDLEEI